MHFQINFTDVSFFIFTHFLQRGVGIKATFCVFDIAALNYVFF